MELVEEFIISTEGDSESESEDSSLKGAHR